MLGSEQGGIRPVVILQNDIGNKFSPTVIVAPFTTQLKKRIPTHIQACEKDNVSKSSIIMLEQLRTIDKKENEEVRLPAKR